MHTRDRDPGVQKEFGVMGGIKHKLYNYFNQNYQNMFNRYATTTEDEMVKRPGGLWTKYYIAMLKRCI